MSGSFKDTQIVYTSNLPEALREAGITVEEFTARIGCHRDLYFKINRGDRQPTEEYRIAAAAALGVPVDRLFTRTVSPAARG